MAAYLICDVAVHNREALMTYLDLAKGTVEAFGGKYVAQAGDLTIFEGDWSPETVIIVEFPNTDAAKDWYHSETYAPALKAIPAAMVRKMILVDGLGD